MGDSKEAGPYLVVGLAAGGGAAEHLEGGGGTEEGLRGGGEVRGEGAA